MTRPPSLELHPKSKNSAVLPKIDIGKLGLKSFELDCGVS
jgi:hypothetical protein